MPLIFKPGDVKIQFEPIEELVLEDLPLKFEFTGTFEPADYESAKALCEMVGCEPPKLH